MAQSVSYTHLQDAEKALLSKLGRDIINLAEVGGVDGYYSAYDFFLNYLKEKPSEWNGKVSFEMCIRDR